MATEPDFAKLAQVAIDDGFVTANEHHDAADRKDVCPLDFTGEGEDCLRVAITAALGVAYRLGRIAGLREAHALTEKGGVGTILEAATRLASGEGRGDE